MRILIATDAWHPQVNGVVRTLEATCEVVRELGHTVEVVAPGEGFRTVGLPTYPDIRVALWPRGEVARRIRAFAPDAVHIATEGPLGWAARGDCLRRGQAFTTSYHTRFPEYVRARAPVPTALTYALMRRFHRPADRTLVTTPSMKRLLAAKGFRNLAVWSRGVDLRRFRPGLRGADGGVFRGLPRPVWLSVGRVAVEKNLPAFLALDLPGTKVVVGDGPARAALARRFPDAVFRGARLGEDLARHFADADVFVFPSRTDTFGLVLIEAMASGTPVAAYPVSGPVDIVPGSGAGVLDADLRAAALRALDLSRAAARASAERYSWQAVGERFLRLLTPARFALPPRRP